MKQWQSYHVYMDWNEQDAFIGTSLRQVFESSADNSPENNFFFIRYSDAAQAEVDGTENPVDPGSHLRIRVFDSSNGFFPGQSNLVKRVIVSQYEPETQRYGGSKCMPSSERCICLDSILVCDALHLMLSIESELPKAFRWSLAIQLSSNYLRLFASEFEQRKALHDALTFWSQRVGFIGFTQEWYARTKKRFNDTRTDRRIIDLLQAHWGGLQNETSLSRRPSVLLSHMHMAMNRCGLSQSEEYAATAFLLMQLEGTTET